MKAGGIFLDKENSENLKISIGVSTTYKRIENLKGQTINSLQKSISRSEKFDFEILVVIQTGQISTEELEKINRSLNDMRKRVQNHKCTFNYHVDKEKGLSRSRNYILRNFSGDYLLIADDDVIYDPNFFKKLEGLLKKSNYDFYTFMIETLEGIKHKNYSKEPFIHNIKTISNVSSIEILLNNTVKTTSLNFDNYFGLGSKWPCGEENIFLSDLLRNKMKGVFIPITVGRHPLPEDMTSMEKDDLVCKGAAITRMYGRYLSLIPIVFLWIKRIKVTKLSGLKYMLFGRKSYLKARKTLQNETKGSF
jgi:glycosyltransferase involved in cell wall biosynthesis